MVRRSVNVPVQTVNATYLETERLGGSRHFELIEVLSDLHRVS
jgi:hypothetical protein